MKTFQIQSLLQKIVSLLVAISLIPIVLVCLVKASSVYTSALTIPTVLFIAVTTLIILGVLSMKGINSKLFVAFLFLIAFGIRFFWISNIDSKNISDFEIMYQAAVRAAHGDFSITSGDVYFYRWGYQLGFTMYQAVILHFFGSSMFTLKLLNVLFSTGTVILVYLIARTLFNESSGRIAGVLYALFIPSIALTSVLTNQHLATFLFYLAFYLIIRFFDSHRLIWIPIGLLLGFGDIIRPLGSLILLVVGLYLLVFGKTTQRLSSTRKLAGIILVFFLTHSLANFVLISSGVTSYPMANREPLWKFVTGLNSETNGIFSDKDSKYLAQFQLGEERNEASKDLIKDRLASKRKLLKLFANKYLYMWTERDGSLIWGLRSDSHDYSNLQNNLTMDERWMYISMALFAVVGAVSLAFERQITKQHALFLLLILGYMSIHLLIELQTRYRYFIIPSFMVMQSYGAFTIYSVYKKWWTVQRLPKIEKSQPRKN